MDLIEKEWNLEILTITKAKYFFVPKAEIVNEGYDLSMSKFKEDVFEEVSYESPKVILEKLKGLEKEIGKGLEELTGMIG
jgi:type I restriction enzyme M protein